MRVDILARCTATLVPGTTDVAEATSDNATWSAMPIVSFVVLLEELDFGLAHSNQPGQHIPQP